MEYARAKVTRVLVEYFGGDDRRIEHALRVLHYADCLAEDYPGCDPDVVVAASLLHDVGIRVSEEKHGFNNGRTQEQYGPSVAGDLLRTIVFPPDKIEIVENIIGNHHSPSRYDYPELALLKAADRIVNREDAGQSLGGDSEKRTEEGTLSGAPKGCTSLPSLLGP
jgi:HD superfamily phosphodiesterase